MSVSEVQSWRSDNGRLIRKKTGREGVTTALALRKWEVRFE